MDRKTHKHFFIKDIEGDVTENEVDIEDVQKSRFIKISRNVTNNKSYQTILEKLELGLTFKANEKRELILELYDSNYDILTLRQEPELVQKWSDLINDELNRLS